MTDTAKAREYRFTTWDDTTLIITVDEIDPGDMGEPRMLVDYDNGPTTYVSVRATLDAERERYAALAEAAAPILDRCLDHATNQDAKDIWRKGGWLMYSDGLVRRENGDPGR